MAAKPVGEESKPAAGRGTTPARIAVVAALAVAVVVLAVVLFSGGGGHKYTLVFQNAGQLVPDNQVLIGGSPVGSVESIDLTDDNLAEVHVEVEQELHEGTTATIRATSLSGVANHYVSISPGPNSNPALDEGAELGLASTTTPVDIDQFFNTFPPRGPRRRSATSSRATRKIYSGQGKNGNDAYKYFGSGLNRTGAFARELNADQRLLSRFIVSSARLTTAVAGRGEQLSSAITNANTAFDAIASQNVAFDATLRELPPVLRQSNTTFVNLRAALDDLEPLVNTAKPATKELAPVPCRTATGLPETRALHAQPAADRRAAGQANDTGDLLAALPPVEQRASRAFPHAEAGDRSLPARTSTSSVPTRPTSSTGSASSARSPATTTATATTCAPRLAAQNLFNTTAAALEPITEAEQFDAFGSSAPVHRRCPGGATQPAADGSNPFVDRARRAASTPPNATPSDVPPGP